LRTDSFYHWRRLAWLAIVATIAGAAPMATLGCERCSRSVPAAVRTKGANVLVPIARAAYVTNNGSDSVSVIDRDGDGVTTVPVDVDPDEKEAPHHLAVDPRAGRAYVALSFPAPPKKTKDPHGGHGASESHGELAWLDLKTLSVLDVREVDHNPGDLVLSHDRARILVTHFDMQRAMSVAAKAGTTGTMFATLQVWDATQRTLLRSRPVCVAPHGTTTTPDDELALVACYGSDELDVVDLASPDLPVARYPLGPAQGVPGAPSYGPYSVVLAPDAKTALVATLEAEDVRVFDLEGRRFVPERTVFLKARAFFPAFVDATHALVPTQAPDGLVRVDVQAATVVARAPWSSETCRAPHVVKQAKDGRVYVVCEGDHVGEGAVVQVDAATLAVVRRWNVGVYPDGIAFGED
jgi:YVTN family beta-propeller protein